MEFLWRASLMFRTKLGSKRPGYTLAELAIVALIIGIMAAVAVPKYLRSISQFRAESAAKRIAADLMYARESAINQGVHQKVVFATATNSYLMPDVANPNSSAVAYSVDLAFGDYPATLLAADFGGSETVTFDIDGQPDAGGSLTVDADGHQRTVKLDAVTGHAAVQ
jgi:prepilin-type N-terminal cleavage/methylation domain-containing protein